MLRGTRILITEGLNLGGLVEGYEVSGGMFADAYSGRSFIPAPETLKKENLNTFWRTLKKQSENLQGRSKRAMKKQRIE